MINAHRREHRELLLEALLRPADHAKAGAIVAELRSQLVDRAGIAADLPQRVHVRGIDAAGVHLVLQCFCSSDLDQALELQQELLLQMSAAIEHHGAELAAPLLGLRSTPGGADRP